MKISAIKYLWLALLLACLPGCISIPPLIKVEHNSSESNLSRRLDAIDHRLDQMEQKLEKR